MTSGGAARRRYDVPDGVELPDLTRVPGVASCSTADWVLTTTYFDTTDRRLSAAGILLHRRTGGEREGWHLELPDDEHAGHTVTVGLGRGSLRVPRRLRDIVAGVTGHEPLSAGATTTTRRRAEQLVGEGDRVLARLTDDVVCAESTDEHGATEHTTAWRSVEVALDLGDRLLLSRIGTALEDAGATPSATSPLRHLLGGPAHDDAPAPTHERAPVEQLVRHRLTGLVLELRTRDPLVRAGLPGGIHSMRIATRRLGATLATCRPFLDVVVTEPLREELDWLADLLGAARDTEVLTDRLSAALDSLVEEEVDLDWEADRIRSEILRPLAGELAQQSTAVRAALASRRYADLLDGLDALGAAPPWTTEAEQSIGAAYRRRVDHELRRARRRFADFARDQSPTQRDESLHAARRAAKRLRYALEPLTTVDGRRNAKQVARLARLQSQLGRHHDTVVVRHYLHARAGDLTSGAALAAGAVIERESRRADDDAVAAMTAWRKIERKHRQGP